MKISWKLSAKSFQLKKLRIILFSKLALIEVAYWQGFAVSHFPDKNWQFWPLWVGTIPPNPENCAQHTLRWNNWKFILFSKLALIEGAYWKGLAVSHFPDKIWQFWPLWAGIIPPNPENCAQNPFRWNNWQFFFSKLALIEVVYW